MIRVLLLAWEGIKTRKTSFLLLSVEFLAASFVMCHVLGLAHDLASARERVRRFRPFEQWYQLSDRSDPEAFARRSASPDFADRLASVLLWMESRDDVEFVVVPKSQVSLGGSAPVVAYAATPNIRTYFGLEMEEGVWLDKADRKQGTPVVAGHGLTGTYRLGQRIGEGAYVCGFLAKGSRVYDLGLAMNPIDLDGLLLVAPDSRVSDAGMLDAILNSPVVRLRSDTARSELAALADRLDIYEYRFWRLDEWLAHYAQQMTRQLAFEGGIVAVVLGYALSAFVFSVLRSVNSRRHEFGVHLAYGASRLAFWLAAAVEIAAAAGAGSAVPLAVFRPPWAWAMLAAAALLAMVLASIPAFVLARRTIPE
ncbi:MAG: hypothetical protein N3B11_07765, partial [Coriobacteriia bacterium]|nr:hypothetical protein [Coriobacteriia bacterium]